MNSRGIIIYNLHKSGLKKISLAEERDKGLSSVCFSKEALTISR